MLWWIGVIHPSKQKLFIGIDSVGKMFRGWTNATNVYYHILTSSRIFWVQQHCDFLARVHQMVSCDRAAFGVMHPSKARKHMKQCAGIAIPRLFKTVNKLQQPPDKTRPHVYTMCIQRFDGVPGVRQWGGAASCAQGCPERTQNLNHELFRLFSPICVASLIYVKTFPNFPCWCVLFRGQ